MAVVAVASSISSSHGFLISNTSIHAMDPTDKHRVVEQLFYVGQSDLGNFFNKETLTTLKISIPGRVFVSTNGLQALPAMGPNPADSSASAATVRFSGNSEFVLGIFEVVSLTPHTIEIRRRPSVFAVVKAYMLTEIFLPQSHQIREIITTGSADIIVEDGVLATQDISAELKLQATGSGDVYMDTTKVSTYVRSVEVTSTGSGNVQWSMGSLQSQKLTTQLSGSGDLTLTSTNIQTTATVLAIAGSGDICVSAPSIATNTLSTAMFGSGSTTISTPSGHCTSADVSVVGSGDVWAGDMKCEDVKVTVASAGDVYVQATHSITGTAWGSGDIKYIGPQPMQISDRHDAHKFQAAGDDKHSKYKPIAKPKTKYHVDPCRVSPVPLREAVSMSTGYMFSGGFGNGSAAVVPLVFFAILSLCYLRCQRKPRPPRTTASSRDPRYGSFNHASEMHPLMAVQLPLPPLQQQPVQQQQQYQQPQQPQQAQQQVYV